MILSLLGMMLVTGCGKKDETNTTDKMKINTSENIEAKTYNSFDNNELIIYVKNNNSYTIGSANVEIRYYNKDNQLVDDDSTVIQNFKSGGTYVATLGYPYDEDLNTYIPEKVEVNIKIDEEYQKEMEEKPNYIDQITTSYVKDENELIVTINNNSGRTLAEVIGLAVYKKNGVPIATSSLLGVDVESTQEDTVMIPTEWNQETNEDVPIEYDEVEIIINDVIDEFEEPSTEGEGMQF